EAKKAAADDAAKHAEEADKPRAATEPSATEPSATEPSATEPSATEAAKADDAKEDDAPPRQFLVPKADAAEGNDKPARGPDAAAGGAPPQPETPWWQTGKGDVQVKLDDLEE